VRKRTLTMAAVVTVTAAMVTVPAAADVGSVPTARVPVVAGLPDSGGAVRDCADAPPAPAPGAAKTAQVQMTCFTKRPPSGAAVSTLRQPHGVGTRAVPSWCVFDTWIFRRHETCMMERGFLEHFTLVCSGGSCRRVTTGWIEVVVRYLSTTGIDNQSWWLQAEVEGLNASGTGIEGVTLSATVGCEGGCFTESNGFPPQHLVPGGVVFGGGWLRGAITGPNQRRYGYGNILLTFNRPGGSYPGQHLQTVGTETRCDSTYYGTTGCVFYDFVPVFSLDFDWHEDAAWHVYEAQRSGLVGNDFPLTRITDPDKIQLNRDIACPEILERPAGKSCDEYPFASTNEGGSMHGPLAGRTFDGCKMDSLPQGVEGPNGWSACFIDESNNDSAGADLGNFYTFNRMINGDKFFVEVD